MDFMKVLYVIVGSFVQREFCCIYLWDKNNEYACGHVYFGGFLAECVKKKGSV